MSVKLQNYVLESDAVESLSSHDPVAFHVLKAIAWRTFEDTDGWCSMTLRQLIREAGYKERAIRSAIRRLVADGFMLAEERQGSRTGLRFRVLERALTRGESPKGKNDIRQTFSPAPHADVDTDRLLFTPASGAGTSAPHADVAVCIDQLDQTFRQDPPGALAPGLAAVTTAPPVASESEGEAAKVNPRRSAPVLPSGSTRILKSVAPGPTLTTARSNLQALIHHELDSGRYYDQATGALNEAALHERVKVYVAREDIAPDSGRWVKPHEIEALIRSVLGQRATRRGRPRKRTQSDRELIHQRAALEARRAARRGEQYLASVAGVSR